MNNAITTRFVAYNLLIWTLKILGTISVQTFTCRFDSSKTFFFATYTSALFIAASTGIKAIHIDFYLTIEREACSQRCAKRYRILSKSLLMLTRVNH